MRQILQEELFVPGFETSVLISVGPPKEGAIKIQPTTIGSHLGQFSKRYFLNVKSSTYKKKLTGLAEYIRLAWRLTYDNQSKPMFSIKLLDEPRIEQATKKAKLLIQAWMNHMIGNYAGIQYEPASLVSIQSVPYKNQMLFSLKRTSLVQEGSFDLIVESYWKKKVDSILKKTGATDPLKLAQSSSQRGEIQLARRTLPKHIEGLAYWKLLQDRQSHGLTLPEGDMHTESLARLRETNENATVMDLFQHIRESLQQAQTVEEVKQIFNSHSGITAIVTPSQFTKWDIGVLRGLTVKLSDDDHRKAIELPCFQHLSQKWDLPITEIPKLMQIKSYVQGSDGISSIAFKLTLWGQLDRHLSTAFGRQYSDTTLNHEAITPYERIALGGYQTDRNNLRTLSMTWLRQYLDETIINLFRIGTSFISRERKMKLYLEYLKPIMDIVGNSIHAQQVKILNNVIQQKSKLRSLETGNLSEIKLDVLLEQLGGELLHYGRVVCLKQKANHRLDHVLQYNGHIAIIENKSRPKGPKMNQQQAQALLDDTLSGRQGSDQYIRERLVKTVGLEIAQKILNKEFASVFSVLAVTSSARKDIDEFSYWLLDKHGNIKEQITNPIAYIDALEQQSHQKQ